MLPFRLRHADVVVGVFVILAVGLLAITGFIVLKGQRIFEERIVFYTVFKEGYGIAPGNTVTVVGIDVGRVRAIELTPDNRVEVSFDVRKTFADRVRHDSRAEVKSPPGLGGFLGGTGIKISVGHPDKPAVRPGGLVQGSDPLGLDDIMAILQGEKAKERISTVLSQIENFSSSLGAPDGKVQTILADIGAITKGMREGRGLVGDVLTDRGQLKPQMVAVLSQTEDLLAQVRARVESVAGILDDVKKSTSKVADAVDVTPEIVRRVLGLVDSLGQSLTETGRIVANLRAVSARVGGVSDDLPHLVAQVEAELHDLDDILGALRKNFLVRMYLDEPRPAAPPDPGMIDAGGGTP